MAIYWSTDNRMAAATLLNGVLLRGRFLKNS